MSRDLEWIYSNIDYLKEHHNPYTSTGRKRYVNAIERFKKLLNHEWLKEFLSRRRNVKILDLCGGAGIGSIALCKVLLSMNFKVELTISDIRRDALELSKKFAREELNLEVSTVLKDAREEFDGKYDLILIYGASTIYFNPWDWIKMLNNISNSLVDDGLFINDDVDRMYTIVYQQGYKPWLIETALRDKLVISVHSEYDFTTGMFKRVCCDLLRTEEGKHFNLFLWSLADLAAYIWLFFKDVDLIIDDPLKPWHAFIIAKEPRRKFTTKELSTIPRFLSKT